MRVTFVLWKDFRVVDMDGDGLDVGAAGIASRSWLAQSFEGDNGSTTLVQSYSQDFFVDLPDGGSLRYQALHSEADIGGEVNPATIQSVVSSSIDDQYSEADDALDAFFGN
jgi:hypothetical protein